MIRRVRPSSGDRNVELPCRNYECAQRAVYAITFAEDDDPVDNYCPDCLVNVVMAMAIFPRFHALIKSIDVIVR